MKQCSKCLRVNEIGLWAPSDSVVPEAEQVLCASCSKGDEAPATPQPDTADQAEESGGIPLVPMATIASSIPQYSLTSGKNLDIEHGYFRGEYIYHIVIKNKMNVLDVAMKEILERLFDEPGVQIEHLKETIRGDYREGQDPPEGLEIDTWCVRVPTSFDGINREYYSDTVPITLAQV